MRFRPEVILKGAVVVTALFVVAAAFAAYLRPDMLLQFANVVLCY
jgi:hypothetical protein